jgi:hypothetical protein
MKMNRIKGSGLKPKGKRPLLRPRIWLSPKLGHIWKGKRRHGQKDSCEDVGG